MTDKTRRTREFIAAQRAIAAQRLLDPVDHGYQMPLPETEPPLSFHLTEDQLRAREEQQRQEFLNATSSSRPALPRGSGR